MTVMPAAIASAIAGLRASGPAGLMMIALTPWAIRVRMSDSWPGASVSRWMIVTFVTLPALTACALAEQSIASRQPLPTPPGFENPIVYLAPLAAPLPPGAVDAPGAVEQAAATTTTAAMPIISLALIDPFWIIRTPPRAMDAPTWSRRERDRPDVRGPIVICSASPPATSSLNHRPNPGRWRERCASHALDSPRRREPPTPRPLQPRPRRY